MLTTTDKRPSAALRRALAEVVNEYQAALARFRPFASRHEGYAILLEELEELWAEIRGNGAAENVRKEAAQVAAMALRMMIDSESLPRNGAEKEWAMADPRDNRVTHPDRLKLVLEEAGVPYDAVPSAQVGELVIAAFLARDDGVLDIEELNAAAYQAVLRIAKAVQKVAPEDLAHAGAEKT